MQQVQGTADTRLDWCTTSLMRYLSTRVWIIESFWWFVQGKDSSGHLDDGCLAKSVVEDARQKKLVHIPQAAWTTVSSDPQPQRSRATRQLGGLTNHSESEHAGR
ncbi:hypothetical protein FKW77_005275 [Venturia effusa]|uniref:Uncharacterized protein n=1 Tax=Venturia effusa TaxID=50376 RepID=A0A517LMU4_9PEZI|nr:hypothetical protein FKW77_005275 [Venturia effusa]